MKSIFLILAVYFFPFISSAGASEKPGVTLKEGINKVSIVVVNTLNTDLVNVTCTITAENIPEWLKITGNSSVISVDKGARRSESMVLFLEVIHPPEYAYYEVPYTLTDEKGNAWFFSFNVFVNNHSQTEKSLEYALYENYPNPFNPSTSIRYSLKENIKTKLVIYNTLGQSVRTLIDTFQNAGIHEIQWNSRDDSGNKVSSGVYFYTLTAGSFTQTKRMILIE